MTETPRPISQVLIDLKNQLPQDDIRVADLLAALHERGFGFALFLFALPAALPLPGLGVNLIIAAPLMFLTVQQALGKQAIWLPERLQHKSVASARFEAMVEAALPFIHKIEILIRPRLGFITEGIFSTLIGLAGLVMALSICVPLPLTNTVPAMGIALMALGVVMRDGLAVIAGAVIGLGWVAMLSYVLIFIGSEGLDLVKEGIKSLL